MAENFRHSDARFYCPGCDKYIGPKFGPIGGAWLCSKCSAEDARRKAEENT